VPSGPDDLADADFATKVGAVEELLHRIADGSRVALADDPAAGSERPSDRISRPVVGSDGV
jgi:hypothetical protein